MQLVSSNYAPTTTNFRHSRVNGEQHNSTILSFDLRLVMLSSARPSSVTIYYQLFLCFRDERKSEKTTYLSGESAKECKPKMAKRKGEILVEKIAQKLGHPQVGPTSVDEQQPLEVPKLGNTVVGCQDGLKNHR